MFIDILNKVRKQDEICLNMKQKSIRFLSIFMIGIIMGFASKYIEGVPHFGHIGDLLNIIGNISTGIGLWVILATIISVYSRSPIVAGIYVFIFFCGLLISYYLYSMKLFGFFPTYYFLRWGGIAICSPVAAYIVWYSRGEGWIAAFCAALPIGLLIEQGSGSLTIISGFNIIGSIVLLVLLPKQKFQVVRIIPLTIIVVMVLVKTPVISYFLGGL